MKQEEIENLSKTSKSWFDIWFNKEYLEIYSHRDSKEAKIQAEFIDQIISKNISKSKDSIRIIDIACGAGRHSIELAKLGYDVTGVDLSKDLIQTALVEKNKIKEQSLNIKFLVSDMRNLQFDEKSFDVALSLFTSFGYLSSDEEHLKLLSHWNSLLPKNGLLFLDFLNSSHIKQNLVEKSSKIINGKSISERRWINHETNRVEKEITINHNGESKKYLESVRLFSNEELVSMLEKVGFKVISNLSDFNSSKKFDKNSKRTLLIAKKQ